MHEDTTTLHARARYERKFLVLAGMQNDNGTASEPLRPRFVQGRPRGPRAVVSVTRARYRGKRKLQRKSLWSYDLRVLVRASGPLAHRQQLFGFAEDREPHLRLRILREQVALCLGDAKHHVFDPVPDHRLDEREILSERLLVDLDPPGLQMLAEIGQHRIVDDEVARDVAA